MRIADRVPIEQRAAGRIHHEVTENTKITKTSVYSVFFVSS